MTMIMNKILHRHGAGVWTSLSVLIAFMLVSCAPAAKIQDYSVRMPDKYIDSLKLDTNSVAKVSWRSFYKDSLLQSYIDSALCNNFDFRNTLERVAMSREEIRKGFGAMFPSVDMGIGAGLQRFGDYTMDGVGNKGTIIPSPYPDFNLNLSFQWEVDIYGKLSQRRKASVKRWMASVEAARAAQTLLISEVANNYYELIGLDFQREIIKEILEYTKHSYELAKQLKEEGEVTQLSVNQFEARLLNLESELLKNKSAIAARERAICLLMGSFPMELERTSFLEIEKNVNLIDELGLPAQLLTLRPDVKAAEYELEACALDVKAARKEFFPSLTIGGSGGFNAFDIAKWFLAPASLVYNIGAGLTAPLFNQNNIRVMWNNANSSQRIALNNYNKVVLNAYEEVVGLVLESQTVASRKEIKRQEVLTLRDATIMAYELFSLQYIGYLEVLTSDQQFFDSQFEYINLIIYYNRIQSDLYRALGGGVF